MSQNIGQTNGHVGKEWPKKIKIVEVGARDGLQNEKQVIGTSDKARFIEMLAMAGHSHIEATSFVRPDKIPQMADAKELFSKLRHLEVSLACLVPNLKGLELAHECGVKEIAVFSGTSDTFNKKNINATTKESLKRLSPVIEKAKEYNMKVRGYVSTAFGCPYEGYQDPKILTTVTKEFIDQGCYEVSIGDTIGSATNYSVAKALELVLKEVPIEKVAMHFHDTRGMALVNIAESLNFGINVFDSSSGGLGGCPYAKGATGNVATEDILYFCDSAGIETGIDFKKQRQASLFMLNLLQKKTTSKFLEAYNNADGNLYFPKA